MDIEIIQHKVFRTSNGEEYGTIRKLGKTLPSELVNSPYVPFACDDCGNYFVQNSGLVAFWDHETSEITVLARSIDEFLKGLTEPQTVTLKPGQLKSAWIDPEFAKKHRSENKKK